MNVGEKLQGMYACLAEAGHPGIELGVTVDGGLGARVRLEDGTYFARLNDEERAAVIRAADLVGLQYEVPTPEERGIRHAAMFQAVR